MGGLQVADALVGCGGMDDVFAPALRTSQVRAATDRPRIVCIYEVLIALCGAPLSRSKVAAKHVSQTMLMQPL